MSFINAHSDDVDAYDAYCDNLSDPPDEEPEMSRHHIIAEVIAHQIKQHGYHLTQAEALDVAAQVVMLDEFTAPEPVEVSAWSPAHGDRQ